LRWMSPFNLDGEVLNHDRYNIPAHYEDLLGQIVRELELKELPDLQSKLHRLKQWYQTEFRYTLDLTISQPSTAMREFLTEVRAGHCEYFATSATLLLRAAGVPARYAVGYAVVERTGDGSEYLIRGTHGHAWCRVWDEEKQRWIDFDPTPVDWLGSSATQVGWMQHLKDMLKQLREDFFLWRTNPANEIYVVGAIALIGLGLGLVVVRRLWRSRSSIGGGGMAASYDGDRENTPLHELESLARRALGSRPSGHPYGRWLMELEARFGRMESLGEAVALHQQWRFDPEPLEEPKRERLRQLVADLKEVLREQLRQAET
ncbi:MAG: transglutaminase-like domain-containing protein, partial [Akkermansiaceae bacterium]|nr:transglutaminase-like domain-containing protein [Akkermansiaceae bacterium]